MLKGASHLLGLAFRNKELLSQNRNGGVTAVEREGKLIILTKMTNESHPTVHTL